MTRADPVRERRPLALRLAFGLLALVVVAALVLVGCSRVEPEPFGGTGRVEYERTMLISLAGALNHESHLCRVMAAEEPDPGLRKFLLASEQRYVALHERALQLLAREHFRAAPAS